MVTRNMGPVSESYTERSSKTFNALAAFIFGRNSQRKCELSCRPLCVSPPDGDSPASADVLQIADLGVLAVALMCCHPLSVTLSLLYLGMH